MEEEVVPSWFMSALEEISGQRPLGNGRVSLGLGFDSFTIAQEEVESIFSQVRKSSAHLITAHHLHGQICERYFFSASCTLSRGAHVADPQFVTSL
jgi:hypothetical protein